MHVAISGYPDEELRLVSKNFTRTYLKNIRYLKKRSNLLSKCCVI